MSQNAPFAEPSGLRRMHDHGCLLVVGDDDEPVTWSSVGDRDTRPWLDRHGNHHRSKDVRLAQLGVAGRRGPALMTLLVMLVRGLPPGMEPEQAHAPLRAWVMAGWRAHPPATPAPGDPGFTSWVTDVNEARVAASLAALSDTETVLLAQWALQERARLWKPDGYTDVPPFVAPEPAASVEPDERQAFTAGLREYRDSVTPSFGDDEYHLLEAYDLGRELAHRLTRRHYDDTTA